MCQRDKNSTIEEQNTAQGHQFVFYAERKYRIRSRATAQHKTRLIKARFSCSESLFFLYLNPPYTIYGYAYEKCILQLEKKYQITNV